MSCKYSCIDLQPTPWQNTRGAGSSATAEFCRQVTAPLPEDMLTTVFLPPFSSRGMKARVTTSGPKAFTLKHSSMDSRGLLGTASCSAQCMACCCLMLIIERILGGCHLPNGRADFADRHMRASNVSLHQQQRACRGLQVLHESMLTLQLGRSWPPQNQAPLCQ